jgi:predicted SAM-dependent methyltransferase
MPKSKARKKPNPPSAAPKAVSGFQPSGTLPPERPGAKRVLHVGCGSKRQPQMPKLFHGEGWQEIRLDIDPGAQPDIIADLMDMAPVPDNSMDAVFSSHNVEHVFIYQVPKVLSEFFRVLKPGGFALITLPDIQQVALQVAQGRLESALYDSPAGPITALDIIYGHTKSIAKGKHYMAHKTAFTAETLGRHLFRAGFTQVTVERDLELNLWARAIKLPKNHPQYTDQITVKGSYKQVVFDLPDPDAPIGKRRDELDVPPVLWKSPF